MGSALQAGQVWWHNTFYTSAPASPHQNVSKLFPTHFPFPPIHTHDTTPQSCPSFSHLSHKPQWGFSSLTNLVGFLVFQDPAVLQFQNKASGGGILSCLCDVTFIHPQQWQSNVFPSNQFSTFLHREERKLIHHTT